jgi:hypothetical protein
MFKIGDKLKFDEYYIKNFISTRQSLTKTLSGVNIWNHIVEQYKTLRWRKHTFDVIKVKDGSTTTFKRLTIKEESVFEGTYIGEIKRKRNWVYNTTGFNPDERGRRPLSRVVEEMSRRDRPSIKPHRTDDARELDTIVLLSLQKNRIIGVPINNIVRHNLMNNYKFL